MTVEIPAALHRKLKKRAAQDGSSVRQLVLRAVEAILEQQEHPRKHRARLPVIRSKGPKVDPTNEQLYSQVEFP